MATLLCIETSGSVCSAAICTNGLLVREISKFEKNSHSKYLTLIIEELLQELESKQVRLDGIGLSLGPGSYTGLRIGTSVAKGLSFSLDIPIVGLTSTAVMAQAYYRQNEGYSGLVGPMIDARRLEVYSAIYTPDFELIEALQPVILDENSYAELLNEHKICFIGDGAQKFAEIMDHPNASFDHAQFLLASEMAQVCEGLFQEQDFLDTAYFEPNYLKEFMALTSKKKFF